MRLVCVYGMLVAVACSNPDIGLANNQELRVSIGAEPGTFDPGQQSWPYEAAVGRNNFETLLKPTRDLKGVTGLAADSYSVDSTGTVYTFKLHTGARWSDGRPVSAADFVYGWQRLLDPRRAAPYSSFYYSVKNASQVNNMDPRDPGLDAALATLGLKAVDDNTFQVTLEAPAGYFKWVASLWTGAPIRKDVVTRAGKDTSGNELWGAVTSSAVTRMVGNGQFKISEVVTKDHITLIRNANYAGSQPRPTLTKITAYEVSDTVSFSKYKSGELDLVAVPPAAAEAARDSPELITNDELAVVWIAINVRKAPFDNVKVRQAFAQAIDRGAYVSAVLRGRAISATTLIPKGMRDYAPQLGTSQAFNVTNAEAALQASGVTAAQLNAMNIKYTYDGDNASATQIAAFIQAQLKTNLGIAIVLDPADRKTHITRLHTGDYQIGGPSGWGADYPDSQDWFDAFLTGAGNFSGYSSSEYDTAVRLADGLVDESQRHNLYATAETVLIQDAPVVFLDQPIDWWLVRPYVKGVNHTPIDDFLGDFHMDAVQIARH